MGVENAESFVELILGLRVLELGAHQSQKLVVVNLPVHVFVNVSNDVVQLVLGRIKAQFAHDVTQLVVLDAVRAVSVEQFPGLADLVFLLE